MTAKPLSIGKALDKLATLAGELPVLEHDALAHVAARHAERYAAIVRRVPESERVALLGALERLELRKPSGDVLDPPWEWRTLEETNALAEIKAELAELAELAHADTAPPAGMDSLEPGGEA